MIWTFYIKKKYLFKNICLDENSKLLNHGSLKIHLFKNSGLKMTATQFYSIHKQRELLILRTANSGYHSMTL